MNEEGLHQPHDLLVRATFSDLANAKAFFSAHLPGAVARSIQWDTLQLVPCSFIDPNLSATQSDLVFRVRRRNREGYLCLLFEHQSRDDPLMAYRFARYVIRLWEQHLRDNPGSRRLPAVFPLVLFQCGSVWKSETRLRDVIDLRPGDPAERWQLDLEFNLVELFRLGYGDLKGTAEGVLALRVLKADAVDELLSDPVWEAEKWTAISLDALSRLVRYICSRDLEREALTRRIHRLEAPKLEETLMTIAEQYRAEGRAAGHASGHAAGHAAGHEAGHAVGHAKGIQEGEVRGSLGAKRKAVVRALEIRHGSVHPDLVARVNAVESGELLDALLEAAICSASLADFERQLPMAG